MSVTARIARWSADVTWGGLPPLVQEHAKNSFRDFLSVMLAGASTRSGQIAAEYARQSRGTVPLAAGGTAAMSEAAFANGVAAAALDFEDGHYEGGAIHPASVVSAAALASVRPDTTVAELLTAQVVGYEVALRAGALLWPKHPKDWYHCTGAAGALGAGAAAAHVRGLDADGTYRAIVIAWQHAPMSTFALPMLKESIGWGACVGAVAANLSAMGYALLPPNYQPAPRSMRPATPFDLNEAETSEFVMSFGHRWESTRTYFKPFAACRYIHAAARGFQEMLARNDLAANDIKEIVVGTHSAASSLSETSPQTLEHAQYSFPHVLAAIALDGRAGAAEISEERLFDPYRNRLASRVRVVHDPSLDAYYPAHYGSKIAIESNDGRRFEATFLDAPGDPDLPLSPAQLSDKWISALCTVMSEAAAIGLMNRLGEVAGKASDLLPSVVEPT